MVAQCEASERKTNRATPLSQAEEDKRLRDSWKWWDYMLWLAGCADSHSLNEWVAQPEQWVLNRKETALTFSDQKSDRFQKQKKNNNITLNVRRALFWCDFVLF